MGIEGYELDPERALYGMYNGYITGDTGYKAVTVSFSSLATKLGNTIINQQVLPMVAKRIEEDYRFLIDEKYKKIFLLSSYLRDDVAESGKDVNRVGHDVNSLSIQVKCLNTMNFHVYSMIPIEGLDTDARYETLEQLSHDIELLNAANPGNMQVKTVEVNSDRNLVIGNAQKLEGNASKFFAIRMYAALMLNKVYRYDLSRIDEVDNQITTLKRFASYINGDIQNHAEIDYSDDVPTRPEEVTNTDIALNTILYGPPGTGKTYAAINDYARRLLAGQGGQVMSAEEILAESIKGLTWWQVSALGLSTFDRPVKIRELMNTPVLQSYIQYVKHRNAGVYDTITTSLGERADDTVGIASKRIGQEYFTRSDNSEWSLTAEGRTYVESELSGVPVTAEARQGSGWSKYYRVVTFHQSYSYEEFVEGIRPRLDDGEGGISYEIKPGIFKELCTIAAQDSDNRYLLIIDEINRGNIAKIFGELITLLEDDKRGRLPVTLPYSQETFTVPRNLYVVGTMNTADRSIALLDIALRRRFEFVELEPEYDIAQINRAVEGVHLGQLLKSINDKITVMIDHDHQIGHSYLMKVSSGAELHRAWYKKILPLIQEYFYNDWEKLEILLGKYNGGNKGFVGSRIVAFPGNGDIDDTTLYEIHQYEPAELLVALKALVGHEETPDTDAV